MKRHLVLIGLPGSGKSTVGKLAAKRLEAPFVDLDAGIARRMQMPVSRIFAEHGEPKFRELEAEAMKQALAGQPSVITPGGGWAAQPGALETARPACFLVYLRTMAVTAAKRAAQTEEVRPLLLGRDPVELMRNLLREREPFYAKADAELKTDNRAPEAVADDVVRLARERAGW
jgi:shikimate kinase